MTQHTSDVIKPSWSHDVMTYCNDKWISKYTYESIFDYLGTISTDAAAAQVAHATPLDQLSKYFVIGGTFTGSSASIDALYVTGLPQPLSGGAQLPITAEALDGKGTMISTGIISAMPVAEGGNVSSYVASLPYSDAIASIRLKMGATTLASRTIATTQPSVRLLEPHNGDEIGGRVHIRWSGTVDVTRQPGYLVQYSRDSGVLWSTVDVPPGATETDWDVASLPGGPLRLRVSVSDGFSSTTDEIGVVARQTAPALTVVRRPDSAKWSETIVLEATSADGAQLTWTSDKAGVLGQGNVIVIGPFAIPLGLHVVTVRASSGATALFTMRIVAGDTRSKSRAVRH